MLCFVCFSTINTPTVFILPCAAGQGSSSAPSASSSPCSGEGAEVPPRPGLTPSCLHSRCRAACTMPMMTMVTMVPQGGRAVLWASKGAWGQERAACPAKIRTKVMTETHLLQVHTGPDAHGVTDVGEAGISRLSCGWNWELLY